MRDFVWASVRPQDAKYEVFGVIVLLDGDDTVEFNGCVKCC